MEGNRWTKSDKAKERNIFEKWKGRKNDRRKEEADGRNGTGGGGEEIATKNTNANSS
jgi:hypothetical protein